MVVPSQPVIRRKAVKSVKPRPKPPGQSRRLPCAIDSIENMHSSFHDAPPTKKLSSAAGITIEEYVSKKPQYDFDNFVPRSIQCPVATSQAFDDAYDYLFKHLSGGCNGLNIIPYPGLREDDDESEEKVSNSAFAALVYVEPGVSGRWEKIEKGLKRIFNAAAIEDGEEPKWLCEGIIFRLCAANSSRYWQNGPDWALLNEIDLRTQVPLEP
ncbi:hypothetical protein TSTA_083900 [Talaromyces stipitatus ATCC 10500]|uniref:Uncharacterized protein n=1 Tax=Talaromyces stipitatus (strain ATCC 10500 / CBS 375.48 / QM 6759 / NRRL 1006) TaxID=441959 RepID=B8M061_TALSN|nr:uncharacterized protein TSTA_083900 [Talaromyces stipitatus ATCC 10500]EED21158.1 hypothetical protein TSTA_083900 [Talaromyces stipitatus ATCC 10500]